MATHEELSLIRDARSGQSSAQLDLGRRYLQGSEGLPKNLEAALHWLGSAATQGSLDACILIGRSVPYEMAKSSCNIVAICHAYEKAFEAGETAAGLVLAKLVLNHGDQVVMGPFRDSAVAALRSAAHSESHEAQWMWAKFVQATEGRRDLALIWTERAAKGGVVAAQYEMSELAWERGDQCAFLEWALPLAKSLQQVAPARQQGIKRSLPAMTDRELKLLMRCAQAISDISDAREAKTFWTIAADAGAMEAQFSLGIMFANVGADGEPTSFVTPSKEDYEQAIQWLVLAGKQGKKEAWFVLSRIHERMKFVGKELDLARHYRQKAAELGHCQAQYECGVSAWTCRRLRATNESRAIYWLELAEAQGCKAAREMLNEIRKSKIDTIERTEPLPDRNENLLFVM